MNKIILAIVAIIVLIGGYYLLKGGYGGSTPTPSGEPSKIINIAATQDFKLTPDAITVKSGEIVKINLINNGTTSHNFTVRGLNIATKTISPGQTDSITFIAPAAGSYTYYCSVDGHEGMGMKGTMTVQ